MKYTIIDGICVTPCPHNMHCGSWVINVASKACRRCKYFKGMNQNDIACRKKISIKKLKILTQNIKLICPHCSGKISLTIMK